MLHLIYNEREVFEMEENKNNIPESIWADGCPENITDEDKVGQEELHAMAIDYLMKNVILKKGFKVEPGFPRREFPNVIMKRDGEIYAVVIFPSVFPNILVPNNELRLKFVEECKKRNIQPLYAPVVYKSIDEERAKAQLTLKGDVFMTSFTGFIRLTDEENQNVLANQDEFFRP